ncbi:MAG: hypothetical protein IJD42_03785 [Clostridia bacterium]|nr:hypothetical protein [Clostridia bacterium]
MKRKLTLVVCVIALFALIFTLASCGENENDDKNHTHTYAQEWTSTAAGHWYASTCGCAGVSSNYGAHVDKDENGVCDTCAYQICGHKFESTWEKDEDNHWKNSTCGCKVVAEKGAHVDADKNGKCDTCEYVVCSHQYATVLSSDAKSHWYAATCGCNVKKDEAAHVDTVRDGKCDVCEYVICAHVDQKGGVNGGKDGLCDDCEAVVCAHTYAETWSKDGAYHWYAATCGCDVVDKKAAHVDADKNGICDDCEAVVCAHTYAETWSKDGAYHWYAATCGCNVVDKKAAHVDEDKDGICDVCDAEVCKHTYSDEKTWDNEGHWYPATCGCDVKKDYEAHAWATEISKNELGHWYVATCGCEATKDFAAHDDTVFDGICDVCTYVICAHPDVNKDGICDDCEYVVCTHEFDNETWSSNEKTHWHPATCGCVVRGDEASHSEDEVCSVCGRSFETKNAIGNLDSEAYLDVNSAVIIENAGQEYEEENSYKVYDNYVVVKDTFGNTRYFSFYGENDNLLFVVLVDEYASVVRDFDTEDVQTLVDIINYSAVYYNVIAKNNEDFIKGLYDLGANGAFDWEGNQIGVSYGFTGKSNDGVYTFSYLYVEGEYVFEVKGEFTVDADVNGIKTASVSISQYDATDVTVDEATDTYVINEGAEAISSETYDIAQTFGAAMDSTSNPNPYKASDYIVDDYKVTVDGETINDGDTINIEAGDELVFEFGSDVADVIKFNEITVSATDSEGEELPEWSGPAGSIGVDRYNDLRPITMVANMENVYTVVISVEGIETEITVNVTYKTPTEIYSVVYDSFNDENVTTNTWEMYFGQELTIKATVPTGCAPTYTAVLGANNAAALNLNEDGTYTFKPVMVGDFEIIFKSTIDETVTTVLNVTVVNPPAISDILNGTVEAEYFEYMTWTEGTMTIVFTPASEGATEGTLTITNVGFDNMSSAEFNKSSTYSYKYNEETNAIELTYVSGEEIEIELSINNYLVCGLYKWENLVFEVAEEEEPEDPVLPEGPTTSPFNVTTTDNYLLDIEEWDKFTFVAGAAGNYTFYVPYEMVDGEFSNKVGLAVVGDSSPRIDYQGLQGDNSATIYLTEGQVIELAFCGPTKGTFEITFEYAAAEAPEEPTVEPGLAGTYVADNGYGTTFDVVITEDTITFTRPMSAETVWTYEVDNGIVTLYLNGEAITNPMVGSATIDTVNNVFAAMSCDGWDYTLTKKPASIDEEEGIAGTYTATGPIEMTVVIDDTTVTFSYVHPMTGMTMNDQYEYTIVDGVVVLTQAGNEVNAMMAAITLTDGVPTAAVYNGNDFTLALAGGEEEETGIAGTYTATGPIEMTVVIDDTTVTFSYVHPMTGMTMNDQYEYTIVDGVVVLTQAGNEVNAMMAAITLTDGVPTAAVYNGNDFTLTLGGGSGGDEPEIPDEPTTGTEENPTVWDEIPSEVTINSDTINKTYFTFTATQTGTLTITYPTADSWADLFEIIDGAVNGQNSQSGYETLTVEFVIEAGKTYRLGIGTWWNAGEFTLPISFTEGEIGGGDEPEEPAGNVLVIGENTVTITESDAEQGGLMFTFTTFYAGQYSFVSNDVGARVFDGEEVVGFGQVELEANKTYNVFVLAAEAGTYDLEIVFTEVGGDEPTEGTMDNPILWEEIPSEVTITSNTTDYTYFKFTATESGALIITFPDGESYTTLYAVVDGEIDYETSQSSSMKNRAQFAIEEGKTYLLGLATFWTSGEFTIPLEVGELTADGSQDYPFAGEFDTDYVANFQGGYTGLYYTFVAPNNGYVTVTSTYEGTPWLQIGTDIDDLTNNVVGMDPETYENIYANTVKMYVFAGQTVYVAVGDGTFEAGEVPFKVTFEAFESESSEKVAGTWTGEVDNWGSITTYTVVINADGTGSIDENYGWGSSEYTITFILVDGSNVTVTAEDEYGNISRYVFVYDADADTLTGTGDINAVFTKA